MNLELKPELLKDKSRLPEIYALRVAAYQDSDQAKYVNWSKFPDGWSDCLDECDRTYHWAIFHKNRIVAAARLALLDDLGDTDGEFEGIQVPLGKPFAYWTRLVVHPDYRKTFAMMRLDRARMNFLQRNQQIKFALASVKKRRIACLRRVGFELLGEVMWNWNGVPGQYYLLRYLNRMG